MVKKLNETEILNKYSIVKSITKDTLYGNNLYLLGSAELGEINKPVHITSIDNLYNTFGTVGTLIDAYIAICNLHLNINIYLCKVTGEYSVLYLNVNTFNGDITNNGLVLKCKYANEIFDSISVQITNTSLTIKFPDNFIYNDLTYDFAIYKNIKNLIEAINKDTLYNKSCIEAYCSDSLDEKTPLIGALDTVNPDINMFYCGDSGLDYTKNEIYMKLRDTYEILKGKNINVIYPIDAYTDDIRPYDLSINGTDSYSSVFYADDKDYLNIIDPDTNTTASFYTQLLYFCENQLNFGNFTHGVIGYNIQYDEVMNNRQDIYINEVAFQALKANQNLSKTNKYFLVSSSVETVYSDYLNKLIPSALIYSCILANTISTITTTNAVIDDGIELYNEFDDNQIQTLADNGLVSFCFNPLYYKVGVCEGVTTMPLKDEMHYTANSRMIHLALCFINKQYSKLYGHSLKMLEKNLIRIMDQLLFNLTKRKLLSSYSIDLTKTDNNTIIAKYKMKTIYMKEYCSYSSNFISSR